MKEEKTALRNRIINLEMRVNLTGKHEELTKKPEEEEKAPKKRRKKNKKNANATNFMSILNE